MRHLKKILCVLAMASIVFWSASGSTAEIVIGFTGPLSGPAGEYGMDCVNGIDMAIKELNAAGGVMADGQKYFFRLERLDDKASPDLAVANARQLLDKNALAIFNPVFTTSAALLKLNEEECGEFILMGYATSPKADASKNNLLVLGTPLMPVYAQIFADYAWEKGWRNAAMVVTLGAYGDEWRQTFKSYWEKMGGKITADKPANYYTRTDFVAPLSAAIATKPDVMLIGGPSATTALVIAQAREIGYKGGFLIIEQAKLDTIAQLLDGTKLMENAIGTASVLSLPVPKTNSFDKKYRETYKRINTWEAVLHYMSMQALARSIASAGTQDNVYAIRAAFPKILPMLGDQFPGDYYGISKNGRMYMPIVVQAIKGGKFAPSEAYVWWTKTPAEFETVKKMAKYATPLKLIKLKIGSIN
jgi:branched-chain amino acid transport system substrate-binding protein